MKDIEFTSSLEGVQEDILQGFFVGWENPPTPARHFALLQNSTHVILAINAGDKKVIGFITALSDHTLAAYIPFLEVLPAYQKRGIGKELTSRMFEILKDHYMVDLLCDPELQSFYEHTGMKKAVGMMKRQYEKQGGV